MVAPSSTARMLESMRTARSVTFSAYVLWPGKIEQALAHAADRGARVTVRLNGYFGAHAGTAAMLRDNQRAVRALRRAGADARIVHRSRSDGPALHLKAAVCDAVAFLDDRNWAGSCNTVVCDEKPADVRAIRTAAAYGSAHCRQVQLDKRSALKSEATLLRTSRGDRVEVVTESIGYSSVYNALKILAQSSVKPRLLISRQDLRTDLHQAQCLEDAGVRVRVASGCEKFAVTAGHGCWTGSANATSPYYNGDQIDWGARTGDARMVQMLRTRFNAQWHASAALPAARSRAV